MRADLRKRLLAERALFMTGPAAEAAGKSLGEHLRAVLAELEPDLLGIYWPHRSEFNAALAVAADTDFAKLRMALPFARRTPIAMEFRTWNRGEPDLVDECGIPSCSGAVVVPDVVVVPCVGYTAEGYRLGYGGGYFDRWLSRHPATTTIGVAWSAAALGTGEFEPLPHDQPLSLIVTERGPVG